jgi:hypothetical protein
MKTIKNLLIIPLFAILLLGISYSEASAGPRIGFYIGTPYHLKVVSKPGPRYVWVEGHYKVNKWGKIVWVPGHWKKV